MSQPSEIVPVRALQVGHTGGIECLVLTQKGSHLWRHATTSGEHLVLESFGEGALEMTTFGSVVTWLKG